MKKRLLVLALIVNSAISGFAQETNLYTFFLNIVNENFRFPLVGFVNIARGNHNLPQFGFVNWNTGDFSTLQAGFVNTVGGDISGVQLGFVNTSIGDLNGWQIGYINTAQTLQGVQIGFVNSTRNGGQGFQLGFVNTSFERLQGVQLGFINFADSIEDGIPIGVISIVRQGGYRAVEFSLTEFHLINIGLKLGVERFYSTLIVGYDPTGDFSQRSFAAGVGFGTIIHINNSFFINPQLNTLNTIGRNGSHLLSFVPNVGFNLSESISITLAPSLTWAYNFSSREVQQPAFSILRHNINSSNDIVIGARAGIRFRF